MMKKLFAPLLIVGFALGIASAEVLNYNVDPLDQGQFINDINDEAFTNLTFSTSLNTPSNITVSTSRNLTQAEHGQMTNVVNNHQGFVLKGSNQLADEVTLSNSIFNVQTEINRSVTNHPPYPKGILKALRSDVNSYLSNTNTTTAQWKKAMRKSVRSESLRNEFISNYGRSAIFADNFGKENTN